MEIDRRLRESRAERSTQQFHPVWMLLRIPVPPNPVSGTSASSAPEAPESMQLDLIHPSLTPEECQRPQLNNLCLYCAEASHYVCICPAKPRKRLYISSGNQSPLSANSAHIALPVSCQLSGRIVSVTAIIDLGTCSCFTDLSFAVQQHISLQTRGQGLTVFLADGSCIKPGLVTKETPPILTITSNNYHELLRLDAMSSPLFPVILGLPWLKAHNPQIDWNSYHHTARNSA